MTSGTSCSRLHSPPGTAAAAAIGVGRQVAVKAGDQPRVPLEIAGREHSPRTLAAPDARERPVVLNRCEQVPQSANLLTQALARTALSNRRGEPLARLLHATPRVASQLPKAVVGQGIDASDHDTHLRVTSPNARSDSRPGRPDSNTGLASPHKAGARGVCWARYGRCPATSGSARPRERPSRRSDECCFHGINKRRRASPAA